MLWFVKRSPDHSQALDRVREWTRSRFTLSEDSAILVTELACGLPGCPPIWMKNALIANEEAAYCGC